MPWDIKQVKGGFKVVTKATGKTHSKKPLTHHMALSQMRAMYVNEPEAKKKG